MKVNYLQYVLIHSTTVLSELIIKLLLVILRICFTKFLQEGENIHYILIQILCEEHLVNSISIFRFQFPDLWNYTNHKKSNKNLRSQYLRTISNQLISLFFRFQSSFFKMFCLHQSYLYPHINTNVYFTGTG